ncbi:MAG TPA: ABC transporter permease [Clostridia bacterium]|nr:ABC transporter permease [Clostridia bacterium]
MKLRRLLTITKKEFIHIKRDKASLMMALVAPIMMLLIFGYAVNTDVNHVELVVCDESRTQESRELIEKFNNSYYFKTFEMVESSDKVEEYIDKGTVKVGLVIPIDYARDIKRNRAAEIQILVDGSDPTIARTAMSYSVILANNHSIRLKELSTKKAQLSAVSAPAVNAKPLVMYNPTLESSKFNVPGVVGLILQNITIILTAFAMVRERERGTIEQLIMTPVTSLELIVGKLIPYILIGFYDFIVILILSYFLFGVAIKGSLLLLILLGTIFLIGALAMGMLISAVAKTQLQAMQAAMLFILPSVLLSGFMFPREAMPKLIYAISCTFPITYFLEILRGIIVKGVGLRYLAGVTSILMLQIAVIILITMKKFKKTLD